jgi:8-oxo-dGTP pyrophosphatase MutT (NUDIX family)
MYTEIFFTDKRLILTDTPTATEGVFRLASSELSKANVLKIFETANTIEVCDDEIADVTERFFLEFKYVKAAGGVVCNEFGDSLMIHRNGRWDLPKGHVEEGESDEACAVREIAEETGVEGAEIVRFLCNTLHSYNVYGVWELKRTAWYELRSDVEATTPQTEEGILRVEWCSERAVEANLQATYPTIRKVFEVKRG